MKKILYIIPVLLVSISQASANELTLNTAGNTSGTAVLSDSLKNSAGQVQTSTDSLANIKDEGSSKEDEFAGRKKVVADALNLAVSEVKDLQARLAKAPKFEEKSVESVLTQRYSAALESYLGYYTAKGKELEGLTTIDEVKAMAKEISDFRSTTYNKSVDEIADFTLLFYTEETINTASVRLNKIAYDIRKLEKLNLVKISTFKPGLDKAAELIKEANVNFEKAEAMILTLKETKAEETKPSLVNGALETPIKITAREYMEVSLTGIKSVYGIFLQISKDVRKAVGLTSR